MLHVKLIEPPCTERYARWCERSKIPHQEEFSPTRLGDPVKEYLPHGVTENEFLERLDPENLENLQKGIAYTMIRRKTFEDARVLKKWQVIIDATELDEGYQKKNDSYLSRCYNRGKADEVIKYHRSIGRL